MVETNAVAPVTMRDFYPPAFFPSELVYEQARLRFAMRKDGRLYGFLGSYRDWRVRCRGAAGTGRPATGAIHELVGKINFPAWWYA